MQQDFVLFLKDESVVDGAKVARIQGVNYDCTGGRSISDCHWQSCVGCICFCDEIGARRIGEIQDIGKKAGVV